MKRVWLLVTVLVMASLLYGSASPAAACTCGAPRTAEEARRNLDDFPLAVFASVVGYTTADLDGKLVMAVERVLNGKDVSSQIVINQTKDLTERLQAATDEPGSMGPDCVYTVAGVTGDRYFLLGDRSSNPGYRLAGCAASTSRALFEAGEDYVFYRAVIDPGGLPVAGGPGDESGGYEWMWALGAAMSLAGLAMVWGSRRLV